MTVTPLPTLKPRFSAKLRKALDYRVREGMITPDTCKAAGSSPAGWHKAMKRPAVQDHLEDVQRQFAQEVEIEALSKEAHERFDRT